MAGMKKRQIFCVKYPLFFFKSITLLVVIGVISVFKLSEVIQKGAASEGVLIILGLLFVSKCDIPFFFTTG